MKPNRLNIELPINTKIVIIENDVSTISILEEFLNEVQCAKIIGRFIIPIEELECLKKEHADILQNYNYSKIKIPTSFEDLFFTPSEIYYLEADGNYTKIHLISNQVILASTNLGKIQQLLASNQFYRISRSHIINYMYIKKINKREKTCILTYLEKDTEIRYTKTIISKSGLMK